MAKTVGRSWRKSALRLLAAGLALGILIGLLLGWEVWPVIWYDTDPCDLRVAHQTSWILMTADSLATTSDLAAAKERAYELLDDDTTAEQVADLMTDVIAQREAAGDSAGALRVQRLSQAVGLPPAGESDFQPPKKRIAAPNKLTGYLVLVGAAVVAAALLVRILAARARAQFEGRVISRAAQAGATPWRRARRAPVIAKEPGRGSEENVESKAQSTHEAGPGPQANQQTATSGPPTPQDHTPASGVAAHHQQEPPNRAKGRPADFVAMPMVASVVSAEPEAPGNVLGKFVAHYHLGSDQFDTSFSINSAKGEFLGECGMGISDVLSSEGEQRVDALEVWLFDRAEIRTVSKFLVSEHANQDQATHDRLAAKGDLLVPRPGSTFLVETLSMGLSVTVTDLAYENDPQWPDSYFSSLRVQMVAKRIDSPVV